MLLLLLFTGDAIVDASAASFTTTLAVSEIFVRTTSASTDVKIVVIVIVGVVAVVVGKTIVDASAAFFNSSVAISDKIGVRIDICFHRRYCY